ncbi:cytochrome c oxidase subunit II [Pontibacillus yanchengensis]|uniref:Cytochrome c oxidase subunit 2 n=1 Tax=Pontibacillus yanchengensis Y32 TaxID=1385514 RepID=A0A0A2TF65_9BACI|nr:cytochrome c oxidase subunit II [Pontibacillus yanchengensis]KGP74204.1 cytochrome B [Pontibacillus yanchengensis Y32]
MKKLSFLFSSMVLFLSGCSMRVFNPISETARDQSFLILFSFFLMMIVLVVVFVMFARFMWKYRETEENKHTIPEDEKGNKAFEITWTVLPIILLIVLAVPTVRMTYDMSAEVKSNPANAVHVEVTAQQFSWTFTYEGEVQTVDNLVLPKDRPVVFHLNSKDVIHSFWIPRLGGKRDVVPGEDRRLILTPEKTGTYQGKCAEFCGVDHAKMRFTTEVKTQEAYQQWLNNEKENLE